MQTKRKSGRILKSLEIPSGLTDGQVMFFVFPRSFVFVFLLEPEVKRKRKRDEKEEANEPGVNPRKFSVFLSFSATKTQLSEERNGRDAARIQFLQALRKSDRKYLPRYCFTIPVLHFVPSDYHPSRIFTQRSFTFGAFFIEEEESNKFFHDTANSIHFIVSPFRFPFLFSFFFNL